MRKVESEHPKGTPSLILTLNCKTGFPALLLLCRQRDILFFVRVCVLFHQDSILFFLNFACVCV